MEKYSLEQERQRLENVVYAENAVKRCTRRHRIHNYIPGQVTYNLGGYPSRFSIMPTEYDEECIKNLAQMGVGLIQVHEEWSDSIRVLGADKYSSHDPAGMRAFIELCHRYGIKIIPYISTGYIDARDPDCREDFFMKEEEDLRLEQIHFRYRHACPQSPSWRQFILGKMENILDNYGFDGFYNDYGYARAEFHRRWCLANGVEFRDDQLPYDPYAEDMLMRAYQLCRERGGGVAGAAAWLAGNGQYRPRVLRRFSVREALRLVVGADAALCVFPAAGGVFGAGVAGRPPRAPGQTR